MNLLLYFVSFGSMFALVASVVAAAVWLVVKFVQAWGRFFQVLLAPPDQRAVRPKLRINPNPHYLKRAGQ